MKKIENGYSFKTGVEKTCKNWLVQWIPAILAGLIAFSSNVPTEWSACIGAIVAFVSYFAKNYIENK